MSDAASNRSELPRHPIIFFYFKDGCHLCEAMESALEKFVIDHQDRFRVQICLRDIESDANWYQRFREYVPVLVVNDEEVCHYFMDEQELLGALGQRPSGMDSM